LLSRKHCLAGVPVCVSVDLSIETAPNPPNRHGQTRTGSVAQVPSDPSASIAPLACPSDCAHFGFSCGVQVPVRRCCCPSFPRPLAGNIQAGSLNCSGKAAPTRSCHSFKACARSKLPLARSLRSLKAAARSKPPLAQSRCSHKAAARSKPLLAQSHRSLKATARSKPHPSLKDASRLKPSCLCAVAYMGSALSWTLSRAILFAVTIPHGASIVVCMCFTL
jgi:hypothetical protein